MAAPLNVGRSPLNGDRRASFDVLGLGALIVTNSVQLPIQRGRAHTGIAVKALGDHGARLMLASVGHVFCELRPEAVQ